ncbi:hypothetical protein G6F50_016620 [Rhizopus delemar]|uniref:SsuA/THI5-like domain-containing protein n=1 Tax=Rhizopus delemar TaxID=936053 RepID=A0A9P6XSR9_9FUNG|nr:hypothetical protein G6F50_016620 [Rhizopus delemar]
MSAVMAGNIDLAGTGVVSSLALMAAGARQFQVIATPNNFGRAEGVLVRDDVKSVADLKGKKIGVTAPGSSTNMVVSFFLAKHGLKASDVSIIGVGAGAGAVTALRSGQIDAISNTDPVVSMLEMPGDIQIIVDTRTLKDTQDSFGGNMPAGCLR